MNIQVFIGPLGLMVFLNKELLCRQRMWFLVAGLEVSWV